MVDTPITRKELSSYYTEITYMDSLLGKPLDYISKANKTKNTISIFTSEQGFSFPFGKWTCYDLGLKTAFIAKNIHEFINYSLKLLNDDELYLQIRKNLLKFRNTRNYSHVASDLLKIINING